MPSDQEADDLGRLYDRLGVSLYRYALMMLTNAAAAEDVVHDVFARLAAKPPRGIASIDGYLRLAVRNACLDALRRRRRWAADDGALLEPVVEGVDPAERLALDAALRSLPADQREVVHLKVYEGLTLQEISDITGVSINTVAGRYRYAIDKLRTALGAKVRT
jgi:RNA polymerase sigma-70 factor (ECF subfamily)